MIQYLDCPHPDQSGITLEFFDSISEIPFLDNDLSVADHQHDFYEMVLILRGSCQHYYRGTSIPLIPGDLFIIPPHQPHSYRFNENISICNCQFNKNSIQQANIDLLSDMDYIELQCKSLEKFQRVKVNSLTSEDYSCEASTAQHRANINSQGIIHLNRDECNAISNEFMSILREQKEQKFDFERVKKNKLEYILMQIKRAQIQQFNKIEQNLTWKDVMINSVLSHIDEDITRDFDFAKMANNYKITQCYFRMIFKEVTGLTPLEYVNRVRILHALDLLQTKNISIAEVASLVGIYDSNYFSRLFKNIIGYPPSFFKSIDLSDKVRS